MENLFDSLARAQSELSRAGIDSAAIGGLAVAAWGRARATQDVDLKVLLDRSQAQTLLDLLAPSYTFLVDQPLTVLTVGRIRLHERPGKHPCGLSAGRSGLRPGSH